MKKQNKVGRPKKKRKYTRKFDLLTPIVDNMTTEVDNALISDKELPRETLETVSNRLADESRALTESLAQFHNIRSEIADFISITNLHVSAINNQFRRLLGE